MGFDDFGPLVQGEIFLHDQIKEGIGVLEGGRGCAAIAHGFKFVLF